MKPTPKAAPAPEHDDDDDAAAERAATEPAPESPSAADSASTADEQGLVVGPPERAVSLDSGPLDPLRTILFQLSLQSSTSASATPSGPAYRTAPLAIAEATPGVDALPFEGEGFRFIGARTERLGVRSYTHDVYLDPSGGVHALVRTKASVVPLSRYYLLSVLSDGTVIETVQAREAYAESTERYVCRAGAGKLEDDVAAHRSAVRRLCKERGVYVIAVRDVKDVDLQQRLFYRAVPGSIVLSVLVTANWPIVAALLAIILAFAWLLR